VKREELLELHYIAPIQNLPSIMARGILSHNRAKDVSHASVADETIQGIRRDVRVPGSGRLLHDHVNLYFHARNPMMYRRLSARRRLCVIRVSTEVLDLPSVVVTDGNAASGYTRFAPAPAGLSMVSRELVFARNWTHPDPIEFLRRRRARCAEILIPERVSPEHLFGAYISCAQSREQLEAAMGTSVTRLDVLVDGDLFFE
jgi:hypothetical protein